MASGWFPKPVLRVQVSALPLTETIRLDEEHVSKTCSGNHSVASSSLAVSAFDEVAEWMKAALCYGVSGNSDAGSNPALIVWR